MELTEGQKQRRAEYRREIDELFRTKDRVKSGAEALEELRDLFESEEELEAFGLHIRQMRDEELARYRD
jgi:hypothetical protein